MNFRRSQDGEVIAVVPNHGREAGRGRGYSSAQRYEAPRTVRYNKSCPYEYSAWVAFSVANDGVPGNVELRRGELTSKCLAGITEFVRKSKYIPALDGQTPVESILVERFFREPKSFGARR